MLLVQAFQLLDEGGGLLGRLTAPKLAAAQVVTLPSAPAQVIPRLAGEPLEVRVECGGKIDDRERALPEAKMKAAFAGQLTQPLDRPRPASHTAQPQAV